MTRKHIEDVARALFAQHGYVETSLADIAKGVGIQKSSIYAHFTCKDDLFMAVFENILATYVQHLQLVQRQIATQPVEQKLYTLLRETCRYYQQSEEDATLLKRAMLFPPPSLKETVRAQFLRSEEQTTAILTAVFEEGVACGILREMPCEDFIAAYYCLIDGLFLEIYYYSSEQFSTKIESAWRVFWRGVSCSFS